MTATGTPGPGVDASGRPVVDPTANVIALNDAAVKRLDDLRDGEARHRAEFAKAAFAHVTEIANLRASYDARLREAETARIDAIRAVDVGAVQRAAEVSAAQAQTLAIQVATSAETLRAQVAAAATASATALGAALDPIQKDIADLRRAQYEAQGVKAQTVDSRSSNGAVLAAVGLALTLVITLIAIAGFLATK